MAAELGHLGGEPRLDDPIGVDHAAPLDGHLADAHLRRRILRGSRRGRGLQGGRPVLSIARVLTLSVAPRLLSRPGGRTGRRESFLQIESIVGEENQACVEVSQRDLVDRHPHRRMVGEPESTHLQRAPLDQGLLFVAVHGGQPGDPDVGAQIQLR